MPIDASLRLRFAKPPKSGAEIRHAFDHPPKPRMPIVEEFLYRRKLTYLIADPGTGKSTIASQVAFSVAGKSPVFGLLEVANPVPIYYVAFETEWEEFQESCTMVHKQIAYDPDLIKFDDEMLGVNILDYDHAKFLTEKIKAFKPGLVIVDPLYLIVSGDLKDGVVASSLAKWMGVLAMETDAAVLALHHTHKERTDDKGKSVKEKDRSYGSRWLKASATLWWQMTENATEDGVALENLKDRYKLSRRNIELKYDPSTRCSMGQTGGKEFLISQIMRYIDARKPGTELTFTEIANSVDCSTNYIYELTKSDTLKGRLERVAKPDRTVVWKVAQRPVKVGEPPPVYVNGENHATTGAK